MTPIVTCTVTGVPVRVLEASVWAYCPDVPLIINKVKRSSFGESFNAAMEAAFKNYDEVIISNDDIVLNPNSYRLMMEDVAALKERHGDKLGVVSSISDLIMPVQNIRYQQNPEETLTWPKWSWEDKVRHCDVVGLGFVWVPKYVFEAERIPPISYYSDYIWTQDLHDMGFFNYISRSYVHHAGSVTLGNNSEAEHEKAMPWICKNKPEFIDRLMGKGSLAAAKTKARWG